MKRLFAAIKIQPDVEFLAKYRELKHALRNEPIKWVEEHNIHVTLKFFGETEEKLIPGICQALKNRASETDSFNMHLTGIGIFGSSYAPKVIWVGLEPYGELTMLIKNIHAELKKIGFEPDRQNVVPHLTLGRIKFIRDKIPFQRVLDQFRDISSSRISIGEMLLYESILRRDGPQYIALEKFSFMKKELP
jgi:2'-5' RNA ligase